jgi:predicted small lipoprotein YifL
MILRLVLIVSLALTAAACGTKSELIMPNGKPNPKSQNDPSQPPQPIGR